MSIHDEIIAQMEIYVTENKKFVEKGVKSSATRARRLSSKKRLQNPQNTYPFLRLFEKETRPRETGALS